MNNTQLISMNDIMAIERPYDKRPIFKISWKMTDFCPYSCSYCYMANAVEKAKKCQNNPTQFDVEEISSRIDELFECLGNKKDSIQLHLIGGEPSIFNLIKVIDKIKTPNLKYLNLATNLYRNVDYYKELKRYCNSRGIEYGSSASFHITQCNPQEYVDKVLELGVQTKIVVNNENLKLYKPYLEMFMNNNISIELTVERNSKNECVQLTDDNLDFVQKVREYQFNRKMQHKSYLPYYTVTLRNGQKINYSSNIAMINSIKEGALDTTGFYCTAGLHNVRIEKNGNLKRSACRLCSMYFKMGNILKGDYEKPNGEIICKCEEKGKDGILQEKYCTAFNNTSMHRLGYNRINGIYNENHGIQIPNYWEETYGQ